MKKFNVAIVGATGMVGHSLVTVLNERNFPVNNLKLLASARSADTVVEVGGKEYRVEEAEPNAFEGVDFAFFSAGGDISLELAPEAVKKGTIVVDNSSAFRMEPDIPLVVPEVNPQDLEGHKGLIANPNCSTIQLVVALQALHEVSPLKRVVVSTYQAVSGAGKEAVDELLNQCMAVVQGKEVVKEIIPHKGAKRNHQIGFNLVPQLDVFQENGYTKEEMKVIKETRKIMGLPDLRITSTTVRVPVMIGHSESVNIEFQSPITVEQAREALEKFPGIIVIDNPDELLYPMPFDCDGKDEVFVGRIRKDESVENGLNIWVVSDNIRKGAATNSIQIAECVIEKGLY
ncbi:MAG: aspartate-semialdehyde dehydrogenase [Firmicutes bacterium HGW-Firmicutes-13]|nr:MAG: aspartate-semialdehyde dehydrogenase [Firmicutes bacterium HGW-Firmicutes-13]